MPKLTTQMIEELYHYGKAVHNGTISIDDATKQVVSKYDGDIADSSAGFYISLYSDYLSGKGSTWNQNSELVLYYVKHIASELGDEAGRNAYQAGIRFARQKSKQKLIRDLEEMRKSLGFDDSQVQPNLGSNTPINSLHITGPFDSWEIVNETTAIKHCDKSFFEHHGSGIPKEICWFFDADNIQQGTSVPVSLIFRGEEFSGRITNESSDRRRTRVFWNADLKRQFDPYTNQKSVCAVFHKKNTGVYEIEMTGGESISMSTKETLSAVKKYIASAGFSYPDGLIENYFLSLKSKPFVILAGTSGTGKTRLVKLFAEAVGANTDNGRYKMVSVRPDWSDSSDLFGHVDLNGKFIPGAIIDFIKRAELDNSHPYFLCLDEMNLARVEYYLSDFLSVIETRDFQAGHVVSDPLISDTLLWSQVIGPRLCKRS